MMANCRSRNSRRAWKTSLSYRSVRKLRVIWSNSTWLSKSSRLWRKWLARRSSSLTGSSGGGWEAAKASATCTGVYSCRTLICSRNSITWSIIKKKLLETHLSTMLVITLDQSKSLRRNIQRPTTLTLSTLPINHLPTRLRTSIILFHSSTLLIPKSTTFRIKHCAIALRLKSTSLSWRNWS
jgi:hypothetical protein